MQQELKHGIEAVDEMLETLRREAAKATQQDPSTNGRFLQTLTRAIPTFQQKLRRAAHAQ